MRLKLGNFHILRTSLHNLTPTNNNGPQPLSTPLRSSRDLNAASNDPLKRSPPRGHNDPSLPFLPPEARTGKEVDISFDIFSFAMTVIQILTRKTPLLDNFQQQIVHALHVSGCNAMDIRNRLFSLLSDCVKFEPGTEPKETRPPSDKILNEMNHIVKILGGDPRAQESQSTYLGKLEAMALEKRKQNERKKSSSSDRERNQFAAPYDYYNNNSTHSLTTMSQNSFQSSISSKPDNYYNEPALIPESFDDNDDGMPLGRSEKGYPGAFPDIPLSPNISRSFPKEMAPQGISPPPLMRSSDSFSITSGENSRRLSANKPVQQPPNNLSTKSRSAKFLDQSSLGCSSNDSYQSLDNENISVLATFLRDKVKCTNSFAKKAASTLVKNGILDVEILKRRLARDRELLFKLGLDEDLAEDIYEIVLGTAQQAPPQPQSQNNISRYFSSNMSIGSNNSIMTSSKLFSPVFFGNNSSNKQSSYSLTYCQTEQQAAEVALHYYDASQCNRASSLQKLKDLASGGDQIAEGFLMRIYALGQCGQPKDFEKASKMGEKLYPWLQLMVQNGSELRSIYARYHLAVCHSEGLGVPKDMKVALGWYKECAERGYAGAQAYLGFCYYMGIGVEKNHPEAVRWYRIAADQGFSGAQANLGICYEHGHGVAKNYDLALKYYRLSAEQGASSAQYNLGNLYERGEGVDQNFYEAAKWYIQSANQSYTPAEYSIGCFYLVGLGIEEDIELGIEFLTKAAEKNYILAQVKLGECYEQGNGVQKNPLRAIKWYYRAAEQGNPAALYYIGYYHFYGITVERDLSKAVEFYTLAAERGHAVAQNNLAICYQNGFGIKKDVVLAMKYFREAAVAGYSQAQFNLGQCYEKGSGVGKSLQEAIKYYKIAAQNDNANAKQALTRLHIQTPLQFDRHPTEDFVQSEA